MLIANHTDHEVLLVDFKWNSIMLTGSGIEH